MPTEVLTWENLQRLPLPLAQLCRRAQNAKDARGRHDSVFYLFEAGVKLGAAAHVQAYLAEIEAGDERRSALSGLVAHLALPSLGHWLAILRELARYFSQRADQATHPLGHVWQQIATPRRDLPAVLALYCRIKNGPDGDVASAKSCSLLQLFEAMVQYRNAVFGHGGPRFDSFFAGEMGPLLFPAANEVIADGVLNLTGPRGTRLVHLGEVRPLSDATKEVAVRELVGIDGWPAPPLLLAADEAARLTSNQVAILWPGHKLPLPLGPLLTFRQGELADEVLFLNRDKNGRAVEYLSYLSGKTERELSTAPALTSMLARLVGHALTTDDLEEITSETAALSGGSEAAPQLRPGRTRGDFELLSELGRGAVGVVYLARQLSLGRLVALKMLAPDMAGDEQALLRFRREIRALGRCDHPNVVKVLTSGTMPDGQLYYAMEYVPGCDLEQIWRELIDERLGNDATALGSSTWSSAVLTASGKGRQLLLARRRTSMRPSAADTAGGGSATGEALDRPLDAPIDEAVATVATVNDDDGAPDNDLLPLPALPALTSIEDDPGGYQRRVATIIRDAAVALDVIHEQGITHRDVKPANLMLTADGSRVVLMDFGLAKGTNLSMAATRSAGFAGTLRYAAPEQLAAERMSIGPPVDIRALGVVMWELLTRCRLFADAQDEAQLAQWIFSHDVPRLRSIDRGLDPDLEAIVARATERAASDRITSARTLAEYLDLYLSGSPLPIRVPPPREMLRRWIRENRQQFLTAVSACLALVVMLVVAFVMITHAWRDALSAKVREREARQVAEQSLYVADMNLAQRAWERHDTAGELELLRRHLPQPGEPDLRDFGWYYLWRICHEEPRLLGHSGPVKAVAFCPGTHLLASASFDRTVRLWDVAARQLVATLDGPTAPLFCVAFSKDGRLVATGGGDRKVRVWDVGKRKLQFELLQDDVITAASFSPDGRTLATGGDDNRVWLWDIDSRSVRQKLTGHTEHVHSVAFSPDGSLLASGSGDGSVRLWNPSDGALVKELKGLVPDIFPVAFSPDGRLLAAGTTDKSVLVWQLPEGQRTATLGGHLDRVETLAFSPDGQLLASADGGGLVIFWRRDASSAAWSKANELRAHAGSIYSVAFSNDGRTLATGGGDATIRLIDVAHAAPDDAEHTTRPTVLADFDSSVNAVAFNPKSALLAAGTENGAVLIHDYKRGTLRATLKGNPHAGAVNALAISQKGHWLAVGRGVWDLSGQVELWQLDGEPKNWKQVPTAISCRNTVTSLAFSPDDQTLAVAGFEHEAALWDVAASPHRLSHQLVGHTHWINAIAYSPDGKTLATASQDYSIRLWNAATGESLRTIPHSGMVRSVAFSPVDHNLLAAGDWDWTVRLLDSRGLASDRVLKGHRGAVNSVVFSPSGKVLTSGSVDGTVKLWQVELGQELITLGELSSTSDSALDGSDRRQIHAVAFDWLGRTLAGASGDNRVRIWWYEVPDREDGQ
ncbi:MAG TPA: protein kinase [Pirellulales bacterium]|jgi:WD40 repeat protein/serine/threonine protein kinase|nr:protein kinase [Pirellulales bacterium]